MAPRRPASPVKPRRTTRARAGNTDDTTTVPQPTARKAATCTAMPTTTRAQALESKSRVTKQSAPAATKKPTRAGRATTRSTRPDLDPEVEDETDQDQAEPMGKATVTRPPAKPTRASRTTAASTTATGLAAAPRRRIKVTPLVLAEPQPERAIAESVAEKAETKPSSNTKREKTTVESKASSAARTKRTATAAALDEPAHADEPEAEPKKRGRARAAKAEEEPETKGAAKTKITSASTKSRGRPKKEQKTSNPVEEGKSEPVVGRKTRARTASVTTPVPTDSAISVIVPKKKVTFEALPGGDEDEKENKLPKSMTKRRAVNSSTTKIEPPATGMRARPLRKPAAARGTKATRGASTKKAASSADQIEVEKTEEKMPRALTPKKITQVAKAMPVESDDEEEDELSGAKTPVRDLSLSPRRRGPTPWAARPLSPVKAKALDFATAINRISPEKATPDPTLGIHSPARRPPTSPLKESLKESPRRAPEGVTVFRAQLPDAHINVFTAMSPSKTQSLLQQSAKRGVTDKIVFPPSAMKSRATPLKTSLLASPARRLFSASKPKTPARRSPSPGTLFENANGTPSAGANVVTKGIPDEVEISSHFRSSVSPQRSARVYRLIEDELAQDMSAEFNFEDSVLDVRSPLKVDKAKPVVADAPNSASLAVAQDNFHNIPEETDESSPLSGGAHEDEVAEDQNDETIMDPALGVEETANQERLASNGVSLDEVSMNEQMSELPEVEQSVVLSRSQGPFFSRLRQVDDDTEDELAGDQTPASRTVRPGFRPSMSAANIRSRLSTGIAPPSASRNLGFTPLAAQVQGWRAASPEKKTPVPAPRSQGIFSPIARIHVTGSVELNRSDTPGSKRKSLAGRHSHAPSMAESPMKPDFFADGMAAHDFEEQVEGNGKMVPEQLEELQDLIEEDKAEPAVETANQAEEKGLAREPTGEPTGEPAELTTDLVNFTHASDTAVVDFRALASEAEELATHEEDAETAEDVADVALIHDNEEDSLRSTVSTASEKDHNDVSEIEHELEGQIEAQVRAVFGEGQIMLSTCSASFGDENAAPIDSPALEVTTPQESEAHADDKTFEDIHDNINDAKDDFHADKEPKQQVAEAYEVTAASIEVSPLKDVCASVTTVDRIEDMDFTVTPVRPDPALPRQIHTVVSKVPLAPEGEVPTVSPLKIQRKRARSLSSTTPPGVKRRSLGLDHQAAFSLNLLSTPKANVPSPQRRVRSAAPSPAISHVSGLITPGQISFTAEDFGDSTLDGLEMPEDELMSDEVDESGIAEQDESMMTVGSSLFKTPIVPSMKHNIGPASVRSNASATPRYAMSTKSSKNRVENTPGMTPLKVGASASRTPATSKAKTPSTSLESKLGAKTPQSGRTPLRAVGSGVLHGAIVHTDIHTSEGMDASAFYVDILTSMGARVVKDWKWNPRASTAGAEDEQPETQTTSTSPGITHVVYKDGGKRALEKVRSAEGQVLCVGVGWVLDCMREGRWLDEAPYAVDQTVLPRGGSRRRKSMEPRMLVNDHGFLSASRDRRSRSMSVGVETSGMSEDMKLELINTPVRGKGIFQQAGTRSENSRKGASEDDTEFSSTYESPTAATVGGGGDTANVGLLIAQQDAVQTPGSQMSRRHANVDISTPQSTSLAVDYDPRTAATPLTPYLVAKGRDLIQKSAPPKQVKKGIFDNEEEDSIIGQKENQIAVGKKFQVKGGKKVFDGRRKTLGVPGMGFKPVVGSPLRKE